MAREPLKPIPMRARAPRAHDHPAPGYRDTVSESIAAMRAKLAEIPEGDPYLAPLSAAVIRATNDCELVRRHLWDAADEHFAQKAALEGVAKGAAQQAAQMTPTSGYGNVGDYETARATAEKRARDQVFASLTPNEETAAKGEKLASNWVESMRALAKALDSCAADWDGPPALRVGASMTIELAQRLTMIERDQAARKMPAKEAVLYLAGLIERGEIEKVGMFIEGVKPLMIRIKNATAKEMAGLYLNAPNGTPDAERDYAWRFLQLVDDFKKHTQPESLKIAMTCMQALRDLFLQLVGVDPKRLSRTEFAAAYLNGGARNATNGADDWKVAGNWLLRAMPTDGPDFSLPGWSPRAASTAYAVLRTPHPFRRS